MCLYPKLVPNPKYKINKKNGGNVPPVTDERVKYVPVGCQKCIECRKKKAREWQVRLLEDIKENKNGKFITLTFSNESILKLKTSVHNECIEKRISIPTDYDLDNAIATYAVRHWLERWRKEYKKSIRHWLVTELGHNGTENIHIHGIVWTDESLDMVEKHWQYGHVWKGKKVNDKTINYVNAQTVNYIVKYVTKIDEKHPNYTTKILTSAGIGAGYTKQKIGNWTQNKYNDENTNETYRTSDGNKMMLPVYYRNKIYNEEEREKLWIQKLNKNIRWVMGQKINISKGEEEYYAALKDAQKTNKQLGYGGDPENWEQEQYERQRRILKQKDRIQNAKYKA